MNLKSYLSLGAASVAVLASAGVANAAALEGRVGINPTNLGGAEAGVNLIGTGFFVLPNGTVDNIANTGGVLPAGANPLTAFDFVPPDNLDDPFDGTGDGAVVELNSGNLDPLDPSSPDDFSPFVSETGTIQDIAIDEITNFVAIPDFIRVEDAFSFQLEELGFPLYTPNATIGGTTVSLAVRGTFFNLEDGSNDPSRGEGTFSVDFEGLNADQVRGLFDEPGEVAPGFSPTTWSSRFVASAAPVPEASNLLGLLVIGLGGASLLVRKK